MDTKKQKAKQERKPKPDPICITHTDCFANSNGKCTCLEDNDFGDRDCPFYKTKK